MTPTAALKSYLQSLCGMKMYPAHMVPEDVTLPYGTFEQGWARFGESYNCIVHLHDWSTEESPINQTANNIATALRGFVDLDCDGGCISLHIGNPMWYPVPDESQREHKHRIVNIEVFNFTT